MAEGKTRVLVVDDSVEMARLLADQLGEHGYEPIIAAGGSEAVKLFASTAPELVITDLRMKGVDGFDVLEAVKKADATVPVLIMTAFGAIDTAIEAIKRGAFHYLTKPFQMAEVLVFVERALADRELRAQNRNLRRLAQERSGLHAIVGRSAPMQALYDLIARVAMADVPVLIRGESGTGKELVARAVHLSSPRRDGSFVAVNCTALPEALLESELFGHLKGAFTGATGTRKGLFVEADGGTLFLDEIADMPPNLQAKLLRVLEDGEIRPVGSDHTRRTNVRIIAASHQPLEDRIKAGELREDLFFRLNVVPVALPPLRDRREDIPLLITHFLAKTKEANPHIKVERFSPELVATLAQNEWTGNVRELENLVKRVAVLCNKETPGLEDLGLQAPEVAGAAPPLERAKASLLTLNQLEQEYVDWMVVHCGGNKTQAARILGIDVSTIHRRGRLPARP